VAGFGLGEQAALFQQGPAESSEGRLAGLTVAHGIGQPGAEGLEPRVEQVLLGAEIVEHGRLGDLRLPRDLGDRHLVEAAGRVQPPRGVRDQLPGLLLLQLAKTHLVSVQSWSYPKFSSTLYLE